MQKYSAHNVRDQSSVQVLTRPVTKKVCRALFSLKYNIFVHLCGSVFRSVSRNRLEVLGRVRRVLSPSSELGTAAYSAVWKSRTGVVQALHKSFPFMFKWSIKSFADKEYWAYSSSGCFLSLCVVYFLTNGPRNVQLCSNTCLFSHYMPKLRVLEIYRMSLRGDWTGIINLDEELCLERSRPFEISRRLSPWWASSGAFHTCCRTETSQRIRITGAQQTDASGHCFMYLASWYASWVQTIFLGSLKSLKGEGHVGSVLLCNECQANEVDSEKLEDTSL